MTKAVGLHWIARSLSHKFIAGTAAGLLASLLLFLFLFVGLYRHQLQTERTHAAEQVNRLLQTSLENAMLKRDLDGLKTIVQKLGEQADIHSVLITNPAGEVRFSSDPARLGKRLPAAALLDQKQHIEFVQPPGEPEILRSINPVRNKPACQECHGLIATHPVNGVLYVNYNAAPLRSQARNTTLLLLGSGTLIVVINLVGGWWFMSRFVLTPVDRLTEASRKLSRGDLQSRVELQGEDELTRLGDTFNRMAANLSDQMRELEEKEIFLKKLINAIPDGVRIIDQDYRILLANRTFYEQLGAQESSQDFCYSAHGRSEPCPANLITCPVQELADRDRPLRVVHKHQHRDGHRLDVEVYAAPMRTQVQGASRLLIVESIRDLEQQIRFTHEQKLSELGRLASGVAHEIHNPLSSVRLALHALQQQCDNDQRGDSQISDYLELVDHEIDNCIEVTEMMLKLSMPPPRDLELVQADTVVAEILRLLKWEAENRRVAINFDAEKPPLRTMATDSELRMMALNLAQNALHAMPDGGKLDVRCQRSDGEIRIVFRDTGVGINAEDMQQVFEPFFSRRADGVRGTGLGLSITKSIVQRFSGHLKVDSRVGEGSSFVVVLPDADAAVET